MEISDHRIRPSSPEPSDEVRDMFDADPVLWPEPKREVARSLKRSPYLPAEEEPAATARVTAGPRRRSPYAQADATPPRTVRSEASPKRRSLYRESAKDSGSSGLLQGSVRVDLKPSRLSLADRLELTRIRDSSAIGRILWLPEDVVVTYPAGMEFGEAREASWSQTGLETLSFALDDLRHRLRRLPLRRARRAVALYGLIVAMIFALFNFSSLQSQISYRINPPKINPALVTLAGHGTTPQAAPTQDFRLLIPKLGKDVPVVLSASRQDKDMQAELINGVVHYSGTALPGEPGNIGLTGHSSNYWWIKSSYNDVFANLDALAPGDVAVIYYGGYTYRYQVRSKQIVPATQAEVLNPTPTNTLTLITCWPVGTSAKRLVVSLAQIDPVPAGGVTPPGDHLPEI